MLERKVYNNDDIKSIPYKLTFAKPECDVLQLKPRRGLGCNSLSQKRMFILLLLQGFLLIYTLISSLCVTYFNNSFNLSHFNIDKE